MKNDLTIDPQLDLIFERTTTIPIEKLWRAWTDPKILVNWFCPKPWKVTECRIDLRPGGEFYTVMQGPDQQSVPNQGCYLDIQENKKLVWTNIMSKGFRPTALSTVGFWIVGTVLLSKTNQGNLYQAIVRHADIESRKKHEAMGFQEGWGMAFQQLVEMEKNL